MKLKSPVYLLIAAALCGTAVSAQLPNTLSGTHRSEAPARPAAVVEIDSVEWRSDLTRVYCRIVGMPHTSDRIDGVTLVSGKRTFRANDIDGVDFRRYFQWEEEGSINLEIDFPAVPTPHEYISITVNTIHGDIKASYGK